MPFRGDRFFAATRQWEWSEIGLYVWALWEQWASGISQAISEETYRSLPGRVQAKFAAVRGGWRNATCAEEYRCARKLYEAKAEAGALGGKAKARNGRTRKGIGASKTLADGKQTSSKALANPTNTTPHPTAPHPVPAGQKEPRANPLVAGRRDALERELNELVVKLAEREDRDPTEVMADLSAYQGRSVMNAASMSDDRLAQTLRAARKRAGNGDAPREPPPPPGDCDPEVYRKAFAASMEAGEPFESSVSFAIEEGRFELKRPGGKSPWQ